MAKASNNEFPSVLFTDGSSDPSTPSANTARVYVKDDSGAGLYLIDDAGSVTGPFVDNSSVTVTGYVESDDGGKEELGGTATSGTAYTINLANGNVQDVTLTDNCTFTFSGTTASVACSFTLILRQDGSGLHTVTWPASVDWPSATAPTISSGASDVDVYTFLTVDNGTTWLGFTAGQDMA